MQDRDYILSIILHTFAYKTSPSGLPVENRLIFYFSVPPEQLRDVRDRRAGPMTALAWPQAVPLS